MGAVPEEGGWGEGSLGSLAAYSALLMPINAKFYCNIIMRTQTHTCCMHVFIYVCFIIDYYCCCYNTF
jgi:hypothetical protein